MYECQRIVVLLDKQCNHLNYIGVMFSCSNAIYCVFICITYQFYISACLNNSCVRCPCQAGTSSQNCFTCRGRDHDLVLRYCDMNYQYIAYYRVGIM